MAFSANAMVAALPLLLWGRLEGLPTIFLASLVAWAWPCILGGFADQQPLADWMAWALTGVLAIKIGGALWLMSTSVRNGYTTWRFPAFLLGGWIAVVAAMSWWFAPWQAWGLASALGPILMIPLVRLAACPLAMAGNRHR
jgi:hypothetical protein